jgi:hypothetical protein
MGQKLWHPLLHQNSVWTSASRPAIGPYNVKRATMGVQVSAVGARRGSRSGVLVPQTRFRRLPSGCRAAARLQHALVSSGCEDRSFQRTGP